MRIAQMLILFLLLLSGDACAADKLTPGSLNADARLAAALIVKPFRDNKLSLAEPAHHPMLIALRRVMRALERAEKLRIGESNNLFQSWSEARAQTSAAALCFRKSGINNASVKEGMARLAGAIALLNKSYSREELRRRRAGNLTPEEKVQFRNLKEKREAVVSRLGSLRDRLAAQDKAPQLLRAINELIAFGRAVSTEQINLATFLALRDSLDAVFGKWEAITYYTEPATRIDWTLLQADVSRLQGYYHEILRNEPVDNWNFFGRGIDRPYEYAAAGSELSEAEIAANLAYLNAINFSREGESGFGAYVGADREGFVAEEPEQGEPSEAPDESAGSESDEEYYDDGSALVEDQATDEPEPREEDALLNEPEPGYEDEEGSDSALVTPGPAEDL